MTATYGEMPAAHGHGSGTANAALRIKQSNANQARALQVERAARRSAGAVNAPSMNQPLPAAPETPNRTLAMPPSEPPALPLIEEAEHANEEQELADASGSDNATGSIGVSSMNRNSSLLKVSLTRGRSSLSGGIQRSQSVASSLSKFVGGLSRGISQRTGSKQRTLFPNFRSHSVETHVVARPRSASKHRVIPSVGRPEGFENLGDYVNFHRTQKTRKKDSDVAKAIGSPTPVLEDLPVEEADAHARVTPFTLQTEDMSEQYSQISGQQFRDNPDEEPSCWNTPEAAAELHAAALRNDAMRIRHLIYSPDPWKRVPVDLPGEEGLTAAVCAAQKGCAVSCAALLDGRADPLARDNFHRLFGDGVWPDERHPDKIGKPQKPPDVPGPDGEPGRTVIYHLRLHGLLDTVLSLVFPMTRVTLVRTIADAMQTWHGKSPLLVAARQGHLELTGLLLSHAAAIPGPFKVQALCFSSGRGQVHWVPSQKERGHALMEAAIHRRWGCAKLLIAAGVPINAMRFNCDSMGRTTLHLAVADGQAEIVEQLLSTDASPHVRNCKGRQPLHEACALGHASVVKVLLAHDADPQAIIELEGIHVSKNCGRDSGKTPLQMAQKHGHTSLYKYLQPELEGAGEDCLERHVAWA